MPHFSLASQDSLSDFEPRTGAVVLDTRSADDFWAGHLPEALHLDAALLVLPRTDAASISRFQALLGFTLSTLGVRADRPVLVYGAAGEVNVARAAWALAYAGVAQVALLDGGLQAAPAVALTRAVRAVTPVRFTVAPVTSLLATAQQLQAPDRDLALIDSRERAEFLGERSNARRHGRIPGARHWDTAAEVDGAGRLQPAEALVRASGAAQRHVVYCGGGGRAARTFVALQLAGQRNAAVYPGSWNEWGNQDDLPLETGAPQAAAS